MVSSFIESLCQFFLGLAFLGVPSYLYAQSTGPATPSGTPVITSQAEIPDAPAPRPTDQDLSAGTPMSQIEVAELALAVDPVSGRRKIHSRRSQEPRRPQQVQRKAAPASRAPLSSPITRDDKHQKAEQEVKEEEHQRMAGIIPAFNVTYRADAVSLTPKQKFELQFHAAIDPYTFSLAAIVAGLDEAEDNNSGFGWGPGGYGKRVAAEYADNVIGNTLGNALLPSILHQDPRYFRLGHGSPTRRALYAFATTWVCKHDNTHKWEPNYSNVLGNMIAGEISNLYYPEQKGKNDTVEAIENGLTVTFEGSFGGELQEFWPDISRKLFHKDPTHGLDAQAAAQDKAWYHDKPEQQGTGADQR